MDKPQLTREMKQALDWGDIRQERNAAPDTMYAVTGRRLYAIGDIDGQFRPRSNPYDLHAFGKPHPDDPLAGKLQGVWAQPVKGFGGYGYTIEAEGAQWDLVAPERFTQRYHSVEFAYQTRSGGVPLSAVRRDYPALDLPVLFSTLTLTNHSDRALELRVVFRVTFDLQDAWFTSLGERRNQGETLSVEGDRLEARSEVLPERWAAAAGCSSPAEPRRTEGSSGELVSSLRLAPGTQATLTFGMAVETESGAEGALELLRNALPDSAAALEARKALYARLACEGPRLISPEPALNEAFAVARANLQFLEAEQERMGRYFYAGLEIFPFWFSNDGAYSVPGLMAAGLREPALNHLRIGLEYLENGRIPHQISPSGRRAFKGNAQETPQWVMSIWDAYRWTGDRVFLAQMYPGARAGLFDYVLGAIDSDGDGYPEGPGMVEVEGMGAEKLDSAAFTWAALRALAEMANVLGETADADLAGDRADQIEARFDADWWDDAGGTYAMSLENPGNERRPVPHWAVVVPLEVGLASGAHAARTFATLRADYLNRWGLKHTVGSDERVWTLPTATLARAALRYGEPELGLGMLRNIAATLEHGSIGLFHELIPEGACIVQLWSAATFLRGIIEDLLGITVRAGLHRVDLEPKLLEEWGAFTLADLTFGDHRISLHFSGGSAEIEHHSGPQPLTVRAHGREVTIPAGGSAAIAG